jgi:hypothetical protein
LMDGFLDNVFEILKRGMLIAPALASAQIVEIGINTSFRIVFDRNLRIRAQLSFDLIIKSIQIAKLLPSNSIVFMH